MRCGVGSPTRGVPWTAVRVDVFTQVPHAFGWLTEQRPLATVLGSELELRLLNYRDTTPLRSGQVDDDPYGGGAGMVLRVDVVDAALEAAYGDDRPARIVALTPQGRTLDQALVEELAQESEVALLSSRFEGFDERIVSHLATDAVSIGPYVLSGGELPAMVAAGRDRTPPARRSCGGLRRARELLRRARRWPRVPALHPPGRLPRLGGAGRAPLGRPRQDRPLAARAEPVPEPRVSGVDERETPLERDQPSGDGAGCSRGRRNRLADDAGRDPARRPDRAARPRRRRRHPSTTRGIRETRSTGSRAASPTPCVSSSTGP